MNITKQDAALFVIVAAATFANEAVIGSGLVCLSLPIALTACFFISKIFPKK